MGIQIGSLKALGDLAKHNAEVSQEITVCGILDEMVSSLSHQNRQIRAAANTALQVGCRPPWRLHGTERVHLASQLLHMQRRC